MNAAPNRVNLYDVLNVGPQASRQQIRESYVRLKQTFSTANQALYSLVSDDEAGLMNAQVEEAFRVLSDDHKRRLYDQSLGVQVDTSFQDEDLTPPSADPFGGGASAVNPPSEQNSKVTQKVVKPVIDTKARRAAPVAPNFRSAHDLATKQARAAQAGRPELAEMAKELLASAQPGDGSVFKSLRELHGVSDDEMQDRIKVSIEYIRAIEANFFERLPRSVFVKGFLRSYCKYLAVPDSEAVISAFIARYDDWQSSKSR
jgi:hypothetical protein